MRVLALLAAAAGIAGAAGVSAHEGMLHEGCAAGQEFTLGELRVTGAFTRATLPNAPVGGGYMTIINAGSEPDRLIGATTEVTDDVELHDVRITNGVMEMTPLPEGVEIPAGGSVTLAPGGLHMMFIGPRAPFKQGECLTLVLQFARAGELPVVLSVGSVGAAAPPPGLEHH
jgi:copper(I)-binding protein